MSKIASTTIALALGVGLSSAASAQSLMPPSGFAPATAPGGTQGIAGILNTREAVRSGVLVGSGSFQRDAVSPETTGSLGRGAGAARAYGRP